MRKTTARTASTPTTKKNQRTPVAATLFAPSLRRPRNTSYGVGRDRETPQAPRLLRGSQAQPPAALAARLPRRHPRPRDAGGAPGSGRTRERPPPVGPAARDQPSRTVPGGAVRVPAV